MLDPTLVFGVQLAEQVGGLLLGYFQADDLKAWLKSDHSVVTQADLEADQTIKTAIRQNYPDDFILSEESQPDELGEVFSASQAAWIIDPLDGTTNFSLGLHYWGVLLARVMNGWPQQAVMYFPAINELYYAQRGQGAFLNHKPLHIKPPDRNRPRTFFATCSRAYRGYQISVPYKTRILGCAAYSLCTVARSAAILSFESTAGIWDLAAPWLVVQEAGGVVETLDGSLPFPIIPGVAYKELTFPILAAKNPEIAHRAHEQILPK